MNVVKQGAGKHLFQIQQVSAQQFVHYKYELIYLVLMIAGPE